MVNVGNRQMTQNKHVHLVNSAVFFSPSKIKSAKCGEVITVVSNAAPPVSGISFKQVAMFSKPSGGFLSWFDVFFFFNTEKKAPMTHTARVI